MKKIQKWSFKPVFASFLFWYSYLQASIKNEFPEILLFDFCFRIENLKFWTEGTRTYHALLCSCSQAVQTYVLSIDYTFLTYFIFILCCFKKKLTLMCPLQRPHSVPSVGLHVQMHAAGHHGEPGAFRQQLNRRPPVGNRSQTPARSPPVQVHCCTRHTDNWARDKGCQQCPPLEWLLE